MGQRGGSAGFLQQTLAGGGVEASAFVDDFHGDVTVQNFVMGAIHNAHSALADLGGNPAMAKNLADQEKDSIPFMLGAVRNLVNGAPTSIALRWQEILPIKERCIEAPQQPQPKGTLHDRRHF